MISVITPTFRTGEWLRLCVASVADQDVEHEHLVQDAGSDDETLDWLLQDRRVKAVVEKDHGMYDAINRGFRRAKGEILAWLNADEQYLPGTLSKVSAWFGDHPEADVLFGNVIFVDANASYLGQRKMQVPLLYHTWTCHLSTLSCAMFFRRRLLAERGFLFNPRWRCSGDAEWMLRLIRTGVKMGTLNEFTSVFTETGNNLSAGGAAIREAQLLRATAPFWARWLRPLIIGHHRVRRLLGGMYRQEPFSYEIFTLESRKHRKRFDTRHPVGRLPKCRLMAAGRT